MREHLLVVFHDEWKCEVDEFGSSFNGRIQDDEIVAACELPQGATVAEFTVFGFDYSEDGDEYMFADRWGMVEDGHVKWFHKGDEDDN